MENPHYESGSQDHVTLTSADSQVSLQEVTGLRLILKQPSPEWKTFGVEDIEVLKTSIVSLQEPKKKLLKERKEINLETLIVQTQAAMTGQIVEEEGERVIVPPTYDIGSLLI
ncbi:uncharacterized protein LOC111716560 [Eurytemora carolleeae]|uniref:uncharacterized protein LOC111716560 n=1 Tax=Eurytemora carolleeae TaxID=1294199 RepID=UPI000C761951|nr:uncharacterized protein LOC111716560 [Eurytemora carolleeae]|eukprot:XP_023347816.1 uncharacterized protein LOC111716560 [Eurytemora affinis]